MAPRRKKGDDDAENTAAMNKEQEAIAKFVRFNTPTETTLFQGNDVHYFTGSRAVDTLYESKYGTKAKGDAKFPDRKSAVRFLEGLFENRLFWRARKLVAKKKEDKKKGDESDANKSPRPETSKKKKKGSDDGNESVSEAGQDEDKKKEEKENKDEKKKKKVKLEVHQTQVFTDTSDVYVWVYDPTPLYKKVIGLGMVVGTIACCLFPLWPMWLRQGVYYLSLGGIGAFGAIVVTAILRTILFGFIWLVTGGRHHLWILPNLTEDCGFFESFKPWYTYEYRPNGKAPPKEEKDKKKKKDKVSDDENETKQDNKKERQEKDESTEKEEPASGNVDEVEDEEVDEEQEQDESQDGSETGSSTGSTGVEDIVTSEITEKPSVPKVRRRVRKDDDFVVVDK